MFINVNTIKCCACETLNLVQSSISINVKLLQRAFLYTAKVAMEPAYQQGILLL